MTAPALTIAPPDWVRRTGVAAIYDAIGDGRFVGGAVRDTLLDRTIGDIDLATPLPPDAVMHRLAAARIKAIPTGIDHGTVTAVAESETIEVTTLRRDVETDGRHAIVAFTDDWAEDAKRRDFTMNALYLSRDGQVWDPTGAGIEDCRAGHVRFVGNPTNRITEDVLRLLRFYRFQAHYGRTEPDGTTRSACRAAVPKLGRLAGERIRHELLRLLAAPDPLSVIRMMMEDSVLQAILPTPLDPDRLAHLIPLEPAPDPIRRLAALLPPDTADLLRLKLSGKDRDRLAVITRPDERINLTAAPPAQRSAIYRLGRARYIDLVTLAAAHHAPPPEIEPLLALAETWQPPSLPISGADLLAMGLPPGERIGQLLSQIEEWWIEEDFRPDRDACLTELSVLVRASP